MLLRLWTDRRGTTAIEYCLIAGLISIAVVVGASAIGTKLQTHYYQTAADSLS